MEKSPRGSKSSSKALPVESFMPVPQRQQSQETISALRSALNEVTNDADLESQPEEDNSDTGERTTRRPKRARACIACRNMKIRCLPIEGQEACLGCSKVNRECVMPGPPRKRQKTVHKVAELEKKINALTDALVKQQSNPTPPNDSPANDKLNEMVSPATRSDTLHSESQIMGTTMANLHEVGSKTNPSAMKDIDWGCKRPDNELNAPYIDVIDRGLLDMETATAMFEYYANVMSPYFPAVAFKPSCKASDIRTNRPMVFLALLAVASPAMRPGLQQDLLTELNRQLSERVMFLGEKSIELVQAILVYTCYYTRTKQAKDLAFNQFIHSAVVMCLDLGMGKKYTRRLDIPGIEDEEIRRTWLSAYYFASSVSVLLRHPSLVRWSSYVDECLNFFATKKDATSSDKWLCCLVNLQRIAEEVSLVFSMDDSTSTTSIADTKTQYHLRAFEKQLAAWKQTVPSTIDRCVVEHVYNSINVYIHEISIHSDHNVDEFRPDVPLGPGHHISSGTFVTTMHIDALIACLDSCHRLLNAYLSLDIAIARAVPNLCVVWNTYSLVALIKLHGVINAPDSVFGNIFTPDLKVDYYLDGILAKLSEVCKDGRWPPAEAFAFLTRKLKSWHVHRKAPYLDSDSDPPRSQVETQDINLATATDHMMRGLPSKLHLPETYGVQSQQQQQQQSQDQFDPNRIGGSQTGDMNFAWSAANYNLNWDEMNFSQDEMNIFDNYMNDAGWMGYLL